jgi:hypothetical protein
MVMVVSPNPRRSFDLIATVSPTAKVVRVPLLSPPKNVPPVNAMLQSRLVASKDPLFLIVAVTPTPPATLSIVISGAAIPAVSK